MTNNSSEEGMFCDDQVREVAAPDDAQLVKAAQGGDDVAFGLIVRRYQERVFNLAFRLVQDFDDAHDVAQETFIRAHAKLRGFRNGSTLFTWIYRIALNNCLNLLRKNKLRSYIRLDFRSEEGSTVLASEGPFVAVYGRPDADLADSEIRERVAAALGHLPSRQRSVFVLRHFDGLSHREISAVVGCTEGSVRASYYHAIRKLQGALCDLG